MSSIDFIDEAGREWAHASRYRALEDENAALRKRVEELEGQVEAYREADKLFAADFDAATLVSEGRALRERAEKAEARVREYEEKLSTEMPGDMKDWWENSKEEWPEVARWVLENRRKRMERAERELDLRKRLMHGLPICGGCMGKYSECQACRADKLQAELAETKLEWARSVDAAAAALQADLDAALLVCEVLGVQHGRAWLSEGASKAGERVERLLSEMKGEEAERG